MTAGFIVTRESNSISSSYKIGGHRPPLQPKGVLFKMVSSKQVVFLSALVGVFVLANAHPVAAQGAQAAPWLQVTVVQVEPAMVDEYMAVQKDFAAQAKKAATPGRTVSRIEVGNTNQF